MSSRSSHSPENPGRVAPNEDLVFERECRVAGVLLLLCVIGAVVMGVALWA